MTRRVCLLLAGPLVLLLPRAAPADGPRQVAADERRLDAVQLKHDGPDLLEFFRRRTLTDLVRANVELFFQRPGRRAAGPPPMPWPAPASRRRGPPSSGCSGTPTRRCASAWRWP